MTLLLGVDIGGTSTEAVLVDGDGVVVDRRVQPSGHGAHGVVDAVVATVDELCRAVGVTVDELDSIGVGAPGAVADGVVRGAQNLHVERVDLAADLAAAWGRTPEVDNDVNAGVLGAFFCRGGTDGSLALLNLGTGLAAGIVLDGRVWRGARGAAGEVGHVSVDPRGPTKAGATPGSLEAYASGSGIQHRSEGVPAADVLARDDVHARAVREELFFGVASALRVLVLTLDVEQVLLGGGLTHLGTPLLDGVAEVVDGWSVQSTFLRDVGLVERVSLLDPTVPTAAIGAAMRGAGHG